MSQLLKIYHLISNPISFFSDNNDNEDVLLRSIIFYIRLHIVVNLVILVILAFISFLVVNQTTILISEKLIDTKLIFYYGLVLLTFLFIDPIKKTTLSWYGWPIHWLVKWVAGRDDFLRAKRVGAYSSIFYWFLPYIVFVFLITKSFTLFLIIFWLVMLFLFIWQTIGIVEQYKISLGKSLFISFLPFLFLFGVLMLIFLYIGLNLGFENMF